MRLTNSMSTNWKESLKEDQEAKLNLTITPIKTRMNEKLCRQEVAAMQHE